LPPGYESDLHKTYPVLYMHDGQNVFESFVEDSYAGSWQADKVADKLIANGELQTCIIVGVSHGTKERIKEYLPPYSHFPLRLNSPVKGEAPIKGAADITADYLIQDVAPYIQKHYRVKSGRKHTATCGSSMGGLFSLYLAWEYPGFAKNHAALSPSIWATKTKAGQFEILEKVQRSASPDIRLWIDSGTYAVNKQGNDGQAETSLANKILVNNGFIDGDNLQHYLDRGADHSESAWRNRLPKVFKYLFLEENE
jgi:predicted alpha/beta superfamily hydrolase